MAQLGLGKAQIARRDADAALAALQKAVELDPKNAEAQYQLGYVQHVMKAERRRRRSARFRDRRSRSSRATCTSARAWAAP